MAVQQSHYIVLSQHAEMRLKEESVQCVCVQKSN
jgi:hypothetical protein